MTKYPLWKYILLIIIVGLGILYSLPNVYGEDPAVQISAHRNTQIDAALVKEVKTTLKAQDLPYQSISSEDNALLIRFKDAETQLKANDVLRAKLGDGYTVALNLASTTPAWLTAIGAKPMKLGLDLRGGVHFLLAIDVDSLVNHRINGDARSIREELRRERIRYHNLRTHKDHSISLQFANKTDMDKALSLIKKQFPELLVTRGGTEGNNDVILQMSPTAKLQAQDYAVAQTTTILRNRINELGVAEPVVQRQGASRIAVDLPGVQDTARAKQILGGTATLEFHLVDIANDVQNAVAGSAPVGTKVYHYLDQPLLLKDQVVLSGTSITGATSSIGEDGRPAVNIRLGGGGEALFYRITGDNVGKPLAIIYVETKLQSHLENGKVVFTPKKTERVINVATIKSALGNNFQITGLDDAKEARNLALLLRAGALPAPISIIEESTVGPSLGKENIKMGIFSVEVGFVFIILFMVAYYRVFGLVANLALGMNLVLLVAVLSILGATLTLPGIAAIVLTVGMAVDANVLISERIREELRNGMSPHASIEAGYERAFSTIVDANVTTLIAAVAMFAIGTGAVKGFAVPLTIGVLTSMYTSIAGTRAVIQLIYGNKRHLKNISIGIKVAER